MNRTAHTLVIITWGLWLGGLIALLLFVTRLFSASRPVAVEAAPVLFRTFAAYQLIVGMVACASGTLLALMSRRSIHAGMTLLMVLALAAALLIRGWTNRMEAIRHAGGSAGPQFKALHAKTSIAYTSAAGLLLIAGIGLILTPPAPRRGPETGAA